MEGRAPDEEAGGLDSWSIHVGRDEEARGTLRGIMLAEPPAFEGSITESIVVMYSSDGEGEGREILF